MCVIFCRPPSHPSLPKAEGAEGVKWGSVGARGRVRQGEEQGQRLSQVTRSFFARGAKQAYLLHTHEHVDPRMHTNTRQ